MAAEEGIIMAAFLWILDGDPNLRLNRHVYYWAWFEQAVIGYSSVW